MNQELLPVSLKKHLSDKALLQQCNSFKLISSYVPWLSNAAFAGIIEAAKFRLFCYDTPILFFSFHSPEQLQVKDEFGILELKNTFYLRLPFEDSKLLEIVNKYTAGKNALTTNEHQQYTERTSKILLIRLINEMKHSKRLELGNKALVPLRAACVMKTLYPDDACVKQSLNNSILSFQNYMNNNDIIELFTYAQLCKNTKDVFLYNVYFFIMRLHELIVLTTKNDTDNVIEIIDKVNKVFKDISN